MKSSDSFICNYWHLFRCVVMLFCGILTVSCNSEKVAPMSLEEDEMLQLAANINTQVRATDAGFELNDSIGLYVTKWQDPLLPSALLNTGNYVDNAWFYLQNLSNDWSSAQSIYYPNDDKKIDIYAYYPYRSPALGTGCNIDLVVAADQSVYKNYTRSDFMVAKALDLKRSPNKVQLTFDHKLSQMVFVLKPGAGFVLNDLKVAKVKVVNAIVDASYDLGSGVEPVPGQSRQDIVPCGSWSEKNGDLVGKMAIVVPQLINTVTYIEISLGNRKFNFKPSSDIKMNSGCSRTFTITVNNTGLDITTAINPWNTCPPVNGEAGEDFEDDAWDGTIADEFCGGNGTAEQPYLICKGSQLAKVADDVNSGRTEYVNVCFKLANDLDMGGKLFPGIGVEREHSFAGHLDGGGHVIRNLYVNKPGMRAGLFTCLRYKEVGNRALSVVKDLGVEGTISGCYVGGIAGEVTYGAIQNCYFKGNLIRDNVGYFGGIYGYSSYPDATVSSCYAIIENATVNADVEVVEDCFGGIIGKIYNVGGNYNNCYAVIRKVSGTIRCAGGLLGAIGRRLSSVPVWFNSAPRNMYATCLDGSVSLPVGEIDNAVDIPSDAFFLIANDEMKSAETLNSLGAAFKSDVAGINDGYPLLSWQ